MKNYMRTYNLPPFLLSVFCTQLLLTPGLNLALACIALTTLTGFCEYIKHSKTEKLAEEQLKRIEAKFYEQNKQIEDLKAQMTSVKLQQGFRRAK